MNLLNPGGMTLWVCWACSNTNGCEEDVLKSPRSRNDRNPKVESKSALVCPSRATITVFKNAGVKVNRNRLGTIDVCRVVWGDSGDEPLPTRLESKLKTIESQRDDP